MILTGMARLGRDAEIRQTQGGDSVATLSLVWNYGRKQDDGRYPSQWINAALWGKRADALAPYLKKGSQHCFVLDDVHIRSYEKRDGGAGVSLEARVMDITLGPKADNQRPQQSAPNAYASAKGKTPVANCPQPDAPAFDDDQDVPF